MAERKTGKQSHCVMRDKMNVCVTQKLKSFFALPASMIILSAALLNGCSNESSPQNEVALELNTSTEPKPEEVVRISTDAQDSFSSALRARFEELLVASEFEAAKLAASTRTFTNAPSEEAFNEALRQYNSAHQAYRLSRVAALLAATPSSQDQYIDDAPMLPGYLDSVEGYPSSGLIHSELPIDITTMLQEYKFSDELYLTLGFHPYEFILKGDASSPVAAWRRFSEEGTKKHSLAAERRRAYLGLLANTLHKNIAEQAARWRQSATINTTKLHDDSLKDQVIKDEKEHSGEESAQFIESLWDELRVLAKNDADEQEAAKKALSEKP